MIKNHKDKFYMIFVILKSNKSSKPKKDLNQNLIDFQIKNNMILNFLIFDLAHLWLELGT